VNFVGVFVAILTFLLSALVAGDENDDSTGDSSWPAGSTIISSQPNLNQTSILDSIFPINGFPAPDGATRGLTFDGTYLWSADNGDGNSQNGPMLYKLDPNTGTIIASYPRPGYDPNGLAWDGQYLWHSDHVTGRIYKLDPSNAAVIDSFPMPGGFPFDLAWYNGYLYAVSGGTTSIYKINPSNHAVLDTIVATYSGAGRPFGLTIFPNSTGGELIAADDHNDSVNEYEFFTSSWINQWSSNPAVYPCGLAFDPVTGRLWESCWSKDSIYVFDVVTAIEDEQKAIPIDYHLFQNFPNPFNPKTTIRYGVLKSSKVTLMVMDLLGRKVATLVNEFKSAGNYQIDWNGSAQPSGIYFYRLQAGRFTEIRKMVLMK
jgi:DNA-binding beta-propeller fold protein YncE